MITNPHSSLETEFCKNWFAGLSRAEVEIVIPEIADYEIRRELIRSRRTSGLARLDWMKATFSYAPITTATMLHAAAFWAAARSAGPPIRRRFRTRWRRNPGGSSTHPYPSRQKRHGCHN
jgi:hypothetical protein